MHSPKLALGSEDGEHLAGEGLGDYCDDSFEDEYLKAKFTQDKLNLLTTETARFLVKLPQMLLTYAYVGC